MSIRLKLLGIGARASTFGPTEKKRGLNVINSVAAICIFLRATDPLDSQKARDKMMREKRKLLDDGVLSNEEIAYFMAKFE